MVIESSGRKKTLGRLDEFYDIIGSGSFSTFYEQSSIRSHHEYITEYALCYP